MYPHYQPIPLRPNYPALVMILGGGVLFGMWVSYTYGGK